MRNTSRSLLITISSLVGACVADDRDPQSGVRADSVDFHVAAVQERDPSVEEVVREAVLLHHDLVARLESRGFTPAEALAAAEAGDEARARELFGFTDDELDAVGARLQAIAAAVEDAERRGAWSEPEAGAEDPEGLRCDWGKGVQCAYEMGGVSWGLRLAGVSWPLALGYVAGGLGVCAWVNCQWERDGSGTSPGTRPKKK